MNFHCMIKGGLNAEELSEIFNDLDSLGYKSFLLTFSSQESDYLIKAASAYKQGQKTKLMFAIRPYAMSPRYLSMMLKGMDDLTNGKIMINIIAGTFDSDAELFIKNTSIEDRKVYAGEFVNNLRKHNADFKISPTIYFSGSSEQTIENVRQYGDGIIILLSDYLKNKKVIDEMNKEKIIRVFIIIDKDEETAKHRFDMLSDGREKENCIHGTEESILKQLSFIGCEDFLVSGIPYDHHNKDLNSFIASNSAL